MTIKSSISGLQSALLASYKHQFEADEPCVICGIRGQRLARHLIEMYHDKVRSSVNDARLPIGLPICGQCAPPCKKCDLPINNKEVIKFFNATQLLFHHGELKWGLGQCDHIHLWALFPRLPFRTPNIDVGRLERIFPPETRLPPSKELVISNAEVLVPFGESKVVFGDDGRATMNVSSKPSSLDALFLLSQVFLKTLSAEEIAVIETWNNHTLVASWNQRDADRYSIALVKYMVECTNHGAVFRAAYQDFCERFPGVILIEASSDVRAVFDGMFGIAPHD